MMWSVDVVIVVVIVGDDMKRKPTATGKGGHRVNFVSTECIEDRIMLVRVQSRFIAIECRSRLGRGAVCNTPALRPRKPPKR